MTDMPWYVIQTYTGREEKVAEMIRRVVPEGAYGECFVPYYEQLRCRKQENQIHVLRLFPGYVFISSDDIDGLFDGLKYVPAMSKVLVTGEFIFTPLYDGEAEFLLGMMDGEHVVRLTYVATDGQGHVSYLSGPLRACEERIRVYQFRKRYANVRLRVAGMEKEVRMGIILNDDVRRETAYGKVEARIQLAGKYRIPADGGKTAPEALSGSSLEGFSRTSSEVSLERPSGTSPEGFSRTSSEVSPERLSEIPTEISPEGLSGPSPEGSPGAMSAPEQGPHFAPGDQVAVTEGAFEGNVAVVTQVKKDAVRISVHLFGREILLEVPAKDVQKEEV